MLGAFGDFVRNYFDMREANTIGADQFFHCKANCQAAQRGEYGSFFAEHFSNLREFVDQLTGDPADASLEDQESNRLGREGGMSDPSKPCEQICIVKRPNGMERRQ